YERPWLQHQLTGRAIEHIEVAIARGMNEGLSHASADLQIEDKERAGLIEIPAVLRRHVVGPNELTTVGIARENRRAVVVLVCRESALLVEFDASKLPPVIGIPRPAVTRAV